jgi:hypothetical protein
MIAAKGIGSLNMRRCSALDKRKGRMAQGTRRRHNTVKGAFGDGDEVWAENGPQAIGH